MRFEIHEEYDNSDPDKIPSTRLKKIAKDKTGVERFLKTVAEKNLWLYIVYEIDDEDCLITSTRGDEQIWDL